jgi:hypothetical protein
MAFSRHLDAVNGSCTPSPPSSLQFSPLGLSLLLLFDVGRRQRSSPSYPPLLPEAKVPRFLHRAGLLFYLVSPELIQLPYKNTHPTSCSFVYLSGVLEASTYHGGRSLLLDPPYRSFSNCTHTFFSVHFFPNFCTLPLSYGLPLSRQYFSSWGLLVHLSITPMPSFPTLLTLPPPLYLSTRLPCHFLGVPLFGKQPADVVRSWSSSCHQPLCGSFFCDGPALRSSSVSILSVFCPSCRRATLDPIPSSLRIDSLGAVP